ncbi:MAG: hypothetical protein GF398_15550 [Chitinivibrionales bacterium]|nr:hypothetical protein [Chitinivibrionales bacterium]
MKDTFLIVRKEFLHFRGSDPSVFVVYVIIVLMYSLVFAANPAGAATLIWWLAFSLIISGTFANMIFIAERWRGNLEIWLTSGVSRKSILFGKMLFVMIMTIVLGALPLVISRWWSLLLFRIGAVEQTSIAPAGPLLYVAATAMNCSSSAWFSFKFTNPRLINFVNLLLLGLLAGAYYGLQQVCAEYAAILAMFAVIASMAGIFILLALRAFESEQVIQPITF